LALLQRVRDEAHRFSVKSHRQRRRKEALEESILTEIPGIGEKKKESLLRRFGSLDEIAESPVEALMEAGLTRKVAEQLLTHLQSQKDTLTTESSGASDDPH